jgi:hypothetical protein
MAVVAAEPETGAQVGGEVPGDPWFNAYRLPATARGFAPVHEVLIKLQAYERRKRVRATKDRHWLQDIITALVADLTYHYLNRSPGEGLVVQRAKKELGRSSRYQPGLITRSFPKLLDALAAPELNYVKQRTGEFSGMPGKSRRTTIRAGAGLIALIEKHGITFEDLRVPVSEEVIILKRPKRNFADEGGSIEYEDTATTKRLRADVREINSWLAQADIKFDPSVYDRPVDTRARQLFRYFANGRFDSGGRLFRGFWETLPKQARLHGITIEGEPVVELDYAQLNPSLAYAEVKTSPPPGDAYTLPGFEHYRDGVKKVFNAMLFDKQRRTKFPKGTKEFFPRGTKFMDVAQLIRQKHPKLATMLSAGRGYRLMFLESEIIMRVLLHLRYRSIVALPVFDSVVVKSSAVNTVQAIMRREFKVVTGLEATIKRESSKSGNLQASVAADIYPGTGL